MRDLAFDITRSFAGQANVIAIPRVFVEFMGSLEAAIFLNQCLYWSDRATARDGWFYKTADDWREEITLSAYHIAKATRTCQEMGFLATDLRQVRGVPTLHYRIDPPAFAACFTRFLTEHYEGVSNALSKIQESLDSAIFESALTETTSKTTEKSDSEPPASPEPKPVTAQQEMVGALAELCAMDLKIKSHAARCGKAATELRKAGYNPQHIANFGRWWISEKWRLENTPVPSLQSVIDKIKRGADYGGQAASATAAAEPPEPAMQERVRKLRAEQEKGAREA